MTRLWIGLALAPALFTGFGAAQERNGFRDAARALHTPSGALSHDAAGVYASDDAAVRFALSHDDQGRWTYHGPEGVAAVKRKVTLRGDQLFLREDDGRLLVKIAAVGGVTAFTDDHRFGVPVLRMPRRAAETPRR